MKRILSIDGGGIRGIIPGQVLIALEEKLQAKSKNPNARIADYFDFFAGTSTGGILTCILLCPDKDNPGKARFSAKEAVDLYVKYGKNIFDVTLWDKVRTVGGIADEKYNAAPLERHLKEYFADLKLSELLKPCIITAYDIENRNTHFFAQHDFARYGASKDFLVRDVCRATSAAPTYFEAASVKSLSGYEYALIDGGVFANNPSLCAYSEVRNAKGNPTAQDMFIVSIGTGSENKRYRYEKAKNYGSVQWIRPVIDIMMAGASETTNYHIIKMFSAQNNLGNYVRVQPKNLGNASTDMDCATDDNIKELVQAGIATAENCPDLDRVVEVLIDNINDPVEFA